MAQTTPKTSAAKPSKSAKSEHRAKVAKPEKPLKPAKDGAEAPVAGLRLGDLVTRVAAATGAKKPDAKASVEATLSILAEALKAGSDLALPPLGKVRVVKTAEKGAATMMTLKLRHPNPPLPGAAASAGSVEKLARKPAVKPLAEDGEDD